MGADWLRHGLFECEVMEEREVLQEAELSGQADSENDLGGSSETMYFIGLDVHHRNARSPERAQELAFSLDR
jgi:hypothetical protein